MEIWRDIDGFEGRYQISSEGRIKSVDVYTIDTIGRRQLHRGKFLKVRYDKDGYKKISLYDGKSYSIHRLVAQAFIPNPNNYPIINHKDENKQNNCVENLEWCSAQYNSMWGTKRERHKEKVKKSVMQYDMDGTFIKKWDSIKDATYSIVGHNSGRIIDCLKGRSVSAYGYRWEYAA